MTSVPSQLAEVRRGGDPEGHEHREEPRPAAEREVSTQNQPRHAAEHPRRGDAHRRCGARLARTRNHAREAIAPPDLS